MKETTNLFVKWKCGQLAFAKVYLIRVYYIDRDGNPETLLKLGFTKQPLQKRVINFLGEMRRATGFTITQYEVVSILYSDKYSKIEYALQCKTKHFQFYSDCGYPLKFQGSGEMLPDTPENCELFTNGISYRRGELVIPYNPREAIKQSYPADNLV
ncbi:hypothetical protein SAMN05444280_1625 [Tangfeifania diversioriginum]|uniref:Uncharacterized protein n=1 Tax=Tangfeifania diversioriginum TaxID=1168035 RepID=A0A1M6PJT0_9BACT|nr:hypothetical protein [Tangfeifania diversioriginum]SHK08177.1 hypothetical protein SAMN05444280_1625 [Tangfeifania diversioriginum]